MYRVDFTEILAVPNPGQLWFRTCMFQAVTGIRTGHSRVPQNRKGPGETVADLVFRMEKCLFYIVIV